MQTGINLADARVLLNKYIKQPYTLNHCRGYCRSFARFGLGIGSGGC